MTISRTEKVKIDGLDLVVDYDFIKGTPARISGPPEHCYPGDSDEINITRVFLIPKDNKEIRVDVTPLIGEPGYQIYDLIEEKLLTRIWEEEQDEDPRIDEKDFEKYYPTGKFDG